MKMNIIRKCVFIETVMVACLATFATELEPTSFERFDQRAKAGERLNVAFFGASLTWGANASDPQTTSYRARIAEKLEARYPEAHFKFFDGAIGGTGSDLGVFRLKRDCLDKRPDLVFLDFSANDDIRNPRPDRLAAYESLMRRIILEGQCPVVQSVFPFQWDATQSSADIYPGRVAHTNLAHQYQVPVGDAIVRVKQFAATDTNLVARLWPLDGAHPGDEGYAFFADAVWAGFSEGVEKKYVCRAPEKMVYAPDYMQWSRTRFSTLKSTPACWKPALVSRVAAWHDGLMSRWLDDVVVVRNFEEVQNPETGVMEKKPVEVASLVVKFRASHVLILGEETVRSGKYYAYIDGNRVYIPRGPYSPQIEFNLNSKAIGGGRQHYALLAHDLDPTVDHTLEIRPILGTETLEELRLESLCLAGGDAIVLEN